MISHYPLTIRLEIEFELDTVWRINQSSEGTEYGAAGRIRLRISSDLVAMTMNSLDRMNSVLSGDNLDEIVRF